MSCLVFVTCRLGNCNFLLHGLPKYVVHSSELCATAGYDHFTSLLQELHWLPVEQRTIYKVLLFIFKALNNLCLSYISDLQETYKPTRTLRSSSMNLFVIPRSKLKSSAGDRPSSACLLT